MNDPWIAPGSHTVRIHESDQCCHRVIAEYFAPDTHPQDSLIMISRPDTFEATKRLLHSDRYGSDRAADSIMFFDAHAALSQLMDGGRPDSVLAGQFFKHVLTEARSGQQDGTMRMYAEMVDVLCENGQHAAALELEDLAGPVFTLDPQLSILCGYSIARFRDGTDASHLHSVCQKHKRAISSESLRSTNASPEQPIYVIDDEASVRRSLCRALAFSDRRVQVFDSAESFLAELNELPRGGVLLDIQLLGMSGLELMRQMKKIGSQWPIIAMSGSVDGGMEEEALRLGARLYLRKPFDIEEVLATI
jgi:CheY-like chemotaxis protein